MTRLIDNPQRLLLALVDYAMQALKDAPHLFFHEQQQEAMKGHLCERMAQAAQVIVAEVAEVREEGGDDAMADFTRARVYEAERDEARAQLAALAATAGLRALRQAGRLHADVVPAARSRRHEFRRRREAMSDEMKIDNEMEPNEVVWEADTPEMIAAILANEPRTKLVNGTAVGFGLKDLPPRTFGVWFCQAPRHVHVELSAHGSLAFTSAVVPLAYTLALALDRTEWRAQVPPPEALAAAWRDVIAVVDDTIDEGFGAAVRRMVGDMGDPSSWGAHFTDERAWQRSHVN